MALAQNLTQFTKQQEKLQASLAHLYRSRSAFRLLTTWRSYSRLPRFRGRPLVRRSRVCSTFCLKYDSRFYPRRSILRQKALEFVHALGTTLHSMKASNAGSEERSMQLHLVIPPPTDHKKDARSLTRADMTVIENSIDGLSVMTYDFSGPNRPGPNAPAPWIESTLQNLRTAYEDSDAAPEVLLGLNFYGNDFTLPQGGGPVIGHQYVALLEKHKPSVTWDEESEEHYFLYDGEDAKHVVFYPTLASISARLNTANDVGSGLSI